MAAQWVLADHRTHSLGQPIKPAAHIRRFHRQPDARRLQAIQRAQTRQTHHGRLSSTANNARRWLASNPDSTTRLRPPASRTSIPLRPVATGSVFTAGVALTRTNPEAA